MNLDKELIEIQELYKADKWAAKERRTARLETVIANASIKELHHAISAAGPEWYAFEALAREGMARLVLGKK